MLMREMDRNEKRTVIKYLNLKGLSLAEISTELNSILGDSAPSNATIISGWKSTKDEVRSGRSVDVCTDDNV